MEHVELLKKLISFQSITPDDANSLLFIKEYLSGFESIEQEVEGVKNLFIYKRFGAGAHLCFGGHVDVVPPGEGWSSAPFAPLEKDGYIYGRGTQDMKSGVAASMIALREAEGCKGMLSLLLTSDEEGDGIYGTKEMLALLKERKMLPDFVVVAEPTCEERFGDTIKIGRRGSINGILTIKGRQGHAAYPTKSLNPVELFAPYLQEFSSHSFDVGGDGFDPSRIVVTDIRGGMGVTNVTPADLRVMFNVRNSTKTSREDIEKYITELLKGLDFTLELKEGSFPFLTNAKSRIVDSIEESIEAVSGLKPSRSTSGGTSDARYFGGAYGIPTVEFGVLNDRIHAIDERVSVDDFRNLCEVFADLVKKF